MILAKDEGNLLEDLRMCLPLVGKYWCKYQTLLDTLFAHIKNRKLDNKGVLLILRTLIYFGTIPVCSQQKS